MPAQFAVFLEGFQDLGLGDLSNAKRNSAAAKAINKVARDARAKAARQIRNQINFPARYVSPGGKRLYVSQQARSGDLEARVTARTRATSLAQFVTNRTRVGKPGVHVEVHPGKARFMKRAFTIKLPQGNAAVTDTRFNLGLAIRLRPGERLNNKVAARRVENGLYVLYGPSVDQIFRSQDGSGVASDLAPGLATDLEGEFLRLLEL